ncbi:MAG: S8 family serine peptidase [Bdellovibrionales bacterium]|nr:S8 family serine peptidase [Bdellovibrionales bacterium]
MTEAFLAWPLSQGSKEILVAVIDTGLDTHHQVLRENLWTNPGETGVDASGRDKASNGVDDDGNGFIDDVHGWNFAGNNNDLSDNHGHGTHVAGIIESVAPKTGIMVLKYYDPNASGEDNLTNTVKAIRYAIKMKAKIINYSGGGTTKYPDEELAIREAQQKGILIVAAAGNERTNSDINGFYPADYGLPNIISVTAVDENRKILPSSNFGVSTVDIAAPGKNIVSTLPGGKFGTMTGTSQATAFVTGTAVLLMAQGYKTPESIIQQITSTGSDNSFLVGKTKYETTLNAYRSLVMKGAGLGAFGAGVLNSSTDQDFSSKLDPDSEDPGAEELPFKRIVQNPKMH